MGHGQYILEGRRPVLVTAPGQWSTWFEKADRKVAHDELPNGVRVSTVFLGIDHQFGEGPPVLFETMIFGGEHDQYQERYCTWAEAEAGHKRAVEMVFQA